ncbi:hypothetical protein Pla123a_00680 [Posidoniimonas polymericola]|uniref:Uncharacterized protein n=1 Tax=Posidoniimonas polymericola TaxID=2528002 RepID=A0A5C5ZEI9_9BACT|nr:PilZ domain-containing protein [Posidoniimonas polymericola]TWT85261.1 hypothetical protein Pla123a_00680 [Posidoniimonas polymericola]
MKDCLPQLDPEIIAALGSSGPDRRNLPMTIMIGRCLGCERRLPWPAPKPGYWAAAVPCPECGRWYYTEAHNHTLPVLRLGDQRTPQGLAEQYSPAGMSELERALGSLVPSDDRRGDDRHEVRVNLPAVPLTESLESPCEVLEVRLVNLSPVGCCLQLNEPLSVAYLLLDFSVVGFPGFQALAAVRWLETKSGVTKVGCKFLLGSGGDLPLDAR